MLGNRVAQHTAAIDAAAAAGVGHVIYTSGVNAGSALPLVVSHDHGATEQAIRDRGLRWTALRNGLYAESQVAAAARAVASGHLVHNNGDGATAYVSREDCAAAAAAALTTDGHEDRVYDITGPELVTQAQLAALVSDITGRPSRPSPSTTTRRTHNLDRRRPAGRGGDAPTHRSARRSAKACSTCVSSAVRRPDRPRAA